MGGFLALFSVLFRSLRSLIFADTETLIFADKESLSATIRADFASALSASVVPVFPDCQSVFGLGQTRYPLVTESDRLLQSSAKICGDTPRPSATTVFT